MAIELSDLIFLFYYRLSTVGGDVIREIWGVLRPVKLFKCNKDSSTPADVAAPLVLFFGCFSSLKAGPKAPFDLYLYKQFPSFSPHFFKFYSSLPFQAGCFIFADKLTMLFSLAWNGRPNFSFFFSFNSSQPFPGRVKNR